MRRQDEGEREGVNRRTHRRSNAGWPDDRKRGSNSRFAVHFEGGTSGSSGSPEYGGRSKARRSRQSMNKRRQGDRSNKRRQKVSCKGPATENTDQQRSGALNCMTHLASFEFLDSRILIGRYEPIEILVMSQNSQNRVKPGKWIPNPESISFPMMCGTLY